MGKCRFCRKPISVQYPLVELLTGLAFYCCYRVWRFTPPTFVNSLFLSIIIVLVFTDYRHQILPNQLTLPGAIAGLLLSPLQSPAVYMDLVSIKAASLTGFGDSRLVLSWAGSASGAVIGGGGLLVLALFYEKIRRREGLGMGDVKMMAMVGAFLGVQLTILTIAVGALLGALAGIFLMIFCHMNLQSKLPLGVFLGIGAAFSLFYGFSSLHWYSNILR
jgi:leader peptidase (prepilin peptidase)/N-methyltransferase